MAWFKKNYGLFISLLVHGLIISVPVSISISKHFNEVQLFIIEDEPMHPLPEDVFEPPNKEEPKPKVVEKPKNTQKPIEKKKIKPELKQLEDTNIVEPTILSESATDSLPVTNPAPEPVEIASIPKPVFEIPFGSANAPRFLKKELPQYPIMARRLGKEGKVLLRLTIDENGELLDVEVLESAPYGFTEAAVEAVKKSKFLPAIINGRPVLAKALLPITFKLREE